jgi:hypothetical protein
VSQENASSERTGKEKAQRHVGRNRVNQQFSDRVEGPNELTENRNRKITRMKRGGIA